MSRKISLLALSGIVLAVGLFFFWVIWPFLFPLLFAAVLAVLFWPFYETNIALCRGRRRIAAAVTTGAILTAVVLPIAGGLFLAGQQLVSLGRGLIEEVQEEENGPETRLESLVDQLHRELTEEQFRSVQKAIEEGQLPADALPLADQDPRVREILVELEYNYSREELAEAFRTATVEEITGPEENPIVREILKMLQPYVSQEMLQRIRDGLIPALQGAAAEIYQQTRALLGNLVQFLIAFAIMILALYYFLADGPMMVRVLRIMLPLDDPEEDALFEQFGEICRGVVLATVVAALVQAFLNVVGFAIAGVSGIWLLGVLTMIFAMIPAVGAAGVYLPVGVYLVVQGNIGGGVFVLLFGLLIVSTSDNLIRAYVIHGQSHLHPLIGLVSILGALQVIGLWGLFIGPIVAAFFYSLLRILHDRVERGEPRRSS